MLVRASFDEGRERYGNPRVHEDLIEQGPAAQLRSHAERGECENFRVTTTVLSADGKLLDECVEVCQI